jgi:hypothetical protein
MTKNMLKLLQKQCAVWGLGLGKETAAKRFNKYFCSENILVDSYMPNVALILFGDHV